MAVTNRTRWLGKTVLLLTACGILVGCGLGGEARYPGERRKGQAGPVYGEPASVFGPGGLSLGGTQKPGSEEDGSAGGVGIGVNSFLWRASLDSIAFMPLQSADPFGGTIITDWYTLPESPDERFKINIRILGRALRADGVRASVFRQEKDATGGWVDAVVAEETATNLENAILVRARQMRIAQLGQ